jgi:hypothetical protein
LAVVFVVWKRLRFSRWEMLVGFASLAEQLYGYVFELVSLAARNEPHRFVLVLRWYPSTCQCRRKSRPCAASDRGWLIESPQYIFRSGDAFVGRVTHGCSSRFTFRSFLFLQFTPISEFVRQLWPAQMWPCLGCYLVCVACVTVRSLTFGHGSNN